MKNVFRSLIVKKLNILVLFFFVQLLIACGKKTEDCIDDVVKNSKTETGVTIGVGNCYNKSTPLNSNQGVLNSLPVVNDCFLTWDGEKFARAIPSDLTKYSTVQFPNSTTIAYLPENMSKDVGGELIKANWEKLKALCPALNASEI